MITKPHEPSPNFFLLCIAVVILIAPLFWYMRFVAPTWIGPNGQATGLSLSQAWDCALFWKASTCRMHLEQSGYPAVSQLSRNLLLIWTPILMAFAIAIWFVYEKWLRIRHQVIVSGMVVEKMDALLRAAAYEQKHNQYAKSPGIHMFNGWRYTLQRETNHTFILGAPGGGKTVTFRRMINSVVERGDKAIIFDEKGDYTSITPDSIRNGVEVSPILLAPQDERSAVWDIASDLVNSQDAVELAQRLIPDDGHPFFTASARAVLSGCAIKLMDVKPKEWTWLDLLNETRQDQETLLRIMLRYQRGSDIYLAADYKQVMSTLGQLETKMRLLEMLATAWPDYHGRERFFLRDWLVKKTDQRTVIVQHSGRYAELSDGWISALYAVAVSTVTDSNLLPDDPFRRIWFFLDEWGQLPAIKDFERFVTLGRSKGVCAVLGLQDLSQIAKNYGQEVLEVLMASVGTKIITRINLGPTAERMERDLGETTYYEYRRETQPTGGVKWQKETRRESPVVRSEFSSELGVDAKGVRAFVTGIGKSVYLVHFPFPDGKSAHRDSNKPAKWTYTFEPMGTFTNEADIDAYVKDVLKKSPPARAVPPKQEKQPVESINKAGDQQDLSLEEAYEQAVKEAQNRAKVPADKVSAGNESEQVDLFGQYR